MDLCGQVMSCHAMPVFHGMGLLQIALAVSASRSVYRCSNKYAAVYRSGYGGLQTSLPSCPAKSTECIRRNDGYKLLNWSCCSHIFGGTRPFFSFGVILFDGVYRLGHVVPLL